MPLLAPLDPTPRPRRLAKPAPPAGDSNFFRFAPDVAWNPPVNLYETPVAYVVCFDLAGVDKAKLDLQVVGQSLVLRGNRPTPTDFDPDATGSPPDARCRIHVMEIDYGQFARTVELPANVAQERISAAYRNGLLWVTLPKH